jgi:c(7)-type cytochrome triheme protein
MKHLGWIVSVFLCGTMAAGAQVARVGGGEIVFDLEDASPARFSHDIHVAKADLKCQACHPKLWTTRQKHRPVTMALMGTRRTSCGACHDGKRAFSVAEDCDKCHVDK